MDSTIPQGPRNRKAWSELERATARSVGSRVRSRLLGLSRGTFSLLENQLRVEAGNNVLTSLDQRALEIRLLSCVCSSCSRRVSEHLVVLREALLQIGVGVVVYGGFKATLFQLLAAKTFLSSVLGGDNRRGFSEFPFVSGVFGPSVACFVIVAFPSAVSKMSSWWCRLTLFLQAFSGSCSRWSGGIGVLRGYGAVFKGRSPGTSYSGSDMGVPGIHGNAENITVLWSSCTVENNKRFLRILKRGYRIKPGLLGGGRWFRNTLT
ncbi:hypothetical protein F2Q69_00048932 [Brassica cretica]|uniref:Uncharacterized protein n=1 Tax=Brassica cretica TaxID=69181 RepID=A0A8S9PWE4_BRACR|nr:hypothetical protein F2Q69_00048932 [Brassica cretica]